jgi:uncharacterized protein (UPF0332 family)
MEFLCQSIILFIFYLVSALLSKHDLHPETHIGSKALFNLNFIKPSRIANDYGKLFANLLNWRQESNYADFIEFDKETVLPLIEKILELNNSIKALL